MKNTTDEFSFTLKPSQHGVGVFAVHDIKQGAYLRLFGDEKPLESRIRTLEKGDVPKLFQQYCVDKGESLLCPKDFGNMPIGWYLNHSTTSNATHENYHWYASRDISVDEEILVDYNSLGEPEDAKEGYYK